MNDKVSLEEYLELLNKYEELRGNLIHRNNEYYVLKDDHNQLQSNWNSLREWLEKQKHDTEICKEWNSKNNFNDIDYERDIKRFDFILDKMNELEGNDMK